MTALAPISGPATEELFGSGGEEFTADRFDEIENELGLEDGKSARY
jgi:hypothetical protein